MWAHQPWVGRFLSPGNRGRELAEYAGWCNAVEGNTTFYAEPSASTIERWCEQAPPGFRFAFKLPRTITHDRRLSGADRLVGSFLRRIAPLGERLGPVQVQLPPSFAPTSLPTFEAFVRALPRDVGWVVEFRHTGFFDGSTADRVDDVLAELGMGRVVLDTRPLYSMPPRSDASLDERRTKPRLPIRAATLGPTPVIRVIGADDPEATLDGVSAWVPDLLDWLDDGLEPFVFVHQPENVDSPALARRLFERVEHALAARSGTPPWRLTPLPTPLPVAPRTEVVGQDSLF